MKLPRRLSRDFLILLLATMAFGAAGGVFQSTLNNYLEDVHLMDA